MKQKKKGGFLRMLLGTLGASLLGSLLKGKAQLEQTGFLIPLHSLTNFEIQKYYWCIFKKSFT